MTRPFFPSPIFANPTLIAFGYGLGSLLKSINGIPYVNCLASGTICMSFRMASSFEALYSAFLRMHAQKTWDALMNAPLALDEVPLTEMLQAATKTLFSDVAVLVAFVRWEMVGNCILSWSCRTCFRSG